MVNIENGAIKLEMVKSKKELILKAQTLILHQLSKAHPSEVAGIAKELRCWIELFPEEEQTSHKVADAGCDKTKARICILSENDIERMRELIRLINKNFLLE